ncbi:hypothetical protein D5R93_09640 [Actinomyces lilanjuaniae]|uniref:Uncharacterized protein n=2 Tax=Actinomyces lilanjuaniae TaxID=2321394 RepID=A0ABM6Z4W7_9ACTO|nr:hypothetical protein D5R93_09640 [Actinomyces lilanjuaniae]
MFLPAQATQPVRATRLAWTDQPGYRLHRVVQGRTTHKVRWTCTAPLKTPRTTRSSQARSTNHGEESTMTATIETTTATTASERVSTQAQQETRHAELDRTTFLVAMVAVMLGIATMAVIGAVTGVPAVMFAAALLGVVAAGSCVYTGISTLSR